jgi:hypothetical protein
MQTEAGRRDGGPASGRMRARRGPGGPGPDADAGRAGPPEAGEGPGVTR